MLFGAVFVGLLRISGLFPSHIAGIEMILTIRILARLLLVWVFVIIVGHETFFRLE